MTSEWCALCGFQGVDVDRHIGQVGSVIRDGATGRHPNFTYSLLNMLVDHRLQLEMVR